MPSFVLTVLEFGANELTAKVMGIGRKRNNIVAGSSLDIKVAEDGLYIAEVYKC